jgi:hypothetical protein
MLFVATKDSAKLSQLEINRILTSLHAVAAESSAARSAHLTALSK